MCIWIDKSWYRDTVVQFQHFMQLFLYFLLLMFGIKAAIDIYWIRMEEWEGIRSGHSNMRLVREHLKLNMHFLVFCCDHHNVVMNVNIHVCSWSLCYFVQGFRHAVIWNCFLLMASVLSNSLLCCLHLHLLEWSDW